MGCLAEHLSKAMHAVARQDGLFLRFMQKSQALRNPIKRHWALRCKAPASDQSERHHGRIRVESIPGERCTGFDAS